jgi:signal transduction histidine kinase
MSHTSWKTGLARPVRLVAALLALLLAALHAQADTARPRILVISESDSRLPVVQSLVRGIEAALGPDVTEKGELFIEYLDLLRFGEPEERALFRSFLINRYGDTPLDALAVLGPNALAFVLANRDAIAPGLPIVFGGMGAQGMAQALGDTAPPGVSGVISTFDIRATLDLALTLQPDAPEIVVVAGSAPFDLQWRDTAASDLGETYRALPVRFLPEATAEDHLATVAALDPATVVLYLSVNVDAAGQRFLPWQFAKALAEASPAPVWTLYETIIGTGTAGGHVESLETSGRQIGDMLMSAIAGTPLPPPITTTSTAVLDWRALQRLGLDTSRIPPGTDVRYREPTLWQRHRTAAIITLLIIAAQALTIAALVVSRRRFATSQAALASERAQLVHISRNLRIGQLSAALAHEINQPLAAIQANADAGSRLSRQTPPDLPELASIFTDIASDTGRAAGIIANLRRLMVKGETTFDTVALNDVVSATLALADNELAARGARVEQSLSPDPLLLRGNGPQLQQIVLNLTLNAAEAMANLPESARIVRVSTRRLPDGGSALTVTDAGPGLPSDRREEVFRPFITTKATGLGVGLAICRNIAEAHGGTLAFTDPGGPGARVELTLPPPETQRQRSAA